ncbi:hypothetical protein [Trinickia fusca]|uniref:Uncharacterized protein n=1 Tax=Trinickia fusca TaxID=2419777 RepID=A0A494X871_9BURK|nr:hypothetical protein [Trinickia fusca]RKP44404.1 hypothetical protein D7S89_23085 [Trinickia fusca]
MRIGSAIRCLALIAVLLANIGVSRAGIFDDAMSADTTPVEFSVGSGHYRMPRNYIFQMTNWRGGPQGTVSLRVVYPGFKPFGPDTQDCMLRKIRCRIYEIVMVDDFYTSEETFDSRNRYPKRGPYGFELFEVGPDDARVEYYRKKFKGEMIFFDCIVNDIRGVRNAICHHVERIGSGSFISYYFTRNEELADASEVNEGLRKFIDSFSAGNNK